MSVSDSDRWSVVRATVATWVDVEVVVVTECMVALKSDSGKVSKLSGLVPSFSELGWSFSPEIPASRCSAGILMVMLSLIVSIPLGRLSRYGF